MRCWHDDVETVGGAGVADASPWSARSRPRRALWGCAVLNSALDSMEVSRPRGKPCAPCGGLSSFTRGVGEGGQRGGEGETYRPGEEGGGLCQKAGNVRQTVRQG